MNLSELFGVIRARWWLIGAGVALGAVVAVVTTVLTPKTYESFTDVYITSQGSGDNISGAYQGGLLSQERVKSYTELITSLRLADEIKRDLNLPDEPRDIASEISANATVDTVLITIRVDSRDAQRSAAVASSAGDGFVRLVAEVEAPLNRAQPPAVAARIVQRAAVEPDPVAPSYPVNLTLGVLIGLAVGLASALVVHRRDRSVKSGQQATELTGAAVIGTIPYDPEIASDHLPVHSRPRSSVAESFRQVRTNLRFTSLDARSTVLVVTSSAPGEGKSTTACNLAVAFAKDGPRVVLVEADLRRPRLGRYLGLESTVGLSTVLSRQVGVDGALQPWGGMLSVITSGYLPPDPSELLGSPAMQELLAELRHRFDVVVLDCPPLRAVTDSAVLAGLSDGAVMVCRDGETDASDLARSAADLRQVSARLVGLVMVGGRTRSTGSSGYYDYASIPPVETPRPASPTPSPTPRPAAGLDSAAAPAGPPAGAPAGPPAGPPARRSPAQAGSDPSAPPPGWFDSGAGAHDDTTALAHAVAPSPVRRNGDGNRSSGRHSSREEQP